MSCAVEAVECSCYGCAISRQRVGRPAPNQSAELCEPPDACARDGQCWTHSAWVDEAACDPPSACSTGKRCGAHGTARPGVPA